MKTITECYLYSIENRTTFKLRAIKTDLGYDVQKAEVWLDNSICQYTTIAKNIDPTINHNTILDPYKKNYFIATSLTELKIIKLKLYSAYGQLNFQNMGRVPGVKRR